MKEPWEAGVPSANCTSLINWACLQEFTGACPYRAPLLSHASLVDTYRAPLLSPASLVDTVSSSAANTTGLLAWLNSSASACGTLPIFSESTITVAVAVAGSVADSDADSDADSAAGDFLLLELLDPNALALAIFLNSTRFAMPTSSYRSVYDQRVNGTAFLLLGKLTDTCAG